MQWLFENPRDERVATAAVTAIGTGATIHRGPVIGAPAADVRCVFAAYLSAYVAAVDARARARTFLVNAERFEVLELLEAHGLAGAIECEEHDAWTNDHARIFVRKDAVDLSRGEVIGGSGRESEHYVLWSRPDPVTHTCKLAQLVTECASAIGARTATITAGPTGRSELMITAEDARANGLPAVGMRMTTEKIGMTAQRFPEDGWYLRFNAPPGDLRSFSVRVCTELDLEAVYRACFPRPAKADRFAGTTQVEVAGAMRTAGLCEAGGDQEFLRCGYCIVPIEHVSGHLVIVIGDRIPVSTPASWAEVVQGGLATLATSFTLVPA